MKVEKGSYGFYLHYPEGFKRDSVKPPATGWFEHKTDAEEEAVRLATETGKAFLVLRVVSRVVPWHQTTGK